MKPISFVARGGTGSVDRGDVSADQNLTAIQASAGGEYSFNLRQSDIVRYGRAGTNLEITLADGRVIQLENFLTARAHQWLSSTYLRTHTSAK